MSSIEGSSPRDTTSPQISWPSGPRRPPHSCSATWPLQRSQPGRSAAGWCSVTGRSGLATQEEQVTQRRRPHSDRRYRPASLIGPRTRRRRDRRGIYRARRTDTRRRLRFGRAPPDEPAGAEFPRSAAQGAARGRLGVVRAAGILDLVPTSSRRFGPVRRDHRGYGVAGKPLCRPRERFGAQVGRCRSSGWDGHAGIAKART
jgi:hypothetical protein